MGWLIFAAYMVVTAFYSRACVRRWVRDPDSVFYSVTQSPDRSGAAAAALGVGLIWPLAIVFHLIKDWLWRPLDRDAARRDRLRADRAAWQTRTYSTDQDERRMANDIVSTLDDILRRTR
jgi:hypothetical protein